MRLPKRKDGIHAVYVGNMYYPDSVRPRNFHLKLAKELSNAGIHYHMYPSNPSLYKAYSEVLDNFVFQHCRQGFVHLHATVPVDQLVPEISQYHYGIDILTTEVDRIPGDHEFYTLDTTEFCIDNKLFDYVSAGLYVFLCKARWCQRAIERYGLGRRIRSFADIVSEAKRQYPPTLPPIPEIITTEYWTRRLMSFYDELSIN